MNNSFAYLGPLELLAPELEEELEEGPEAPELEEGDEEAGLLHLRDFDAARFQDLKGRYTSMKIKSNH